MSASAEILIVGGDSLIGAALGHRLAGRGTETVATTRRAERVAARRPYLDLDGWDGGSLDWLPDGCRTALIASAMTNQKACADDADACRRTNVEQTVRLATRLAERAIRVIFLSSNAVFDGTLPGRRSDDATAPVALYGQLKAEAEQALLVLRQVQILRLTKVLHPELPLLARWRQSLVAGEPIDAFTDLYMAPVALSHVVAGMERLLNHPDSGVFHLSGRADVSYHEFACRMAFRLGRFDGLVRRGSIVAAGIDPAQAPRYTSLDMTDSASILGLSAPTADEVLDRVM